MIMSIAGGAVIPPLMGLLADQSGTAAAFYLPAFCFLTVLLFAWHVRGSDNPASRY
jgi:FHS family L-fucose permease-like MFS transporter